MVKTKPKGLDRPSTDTIIRRLSQAHTWLYRRTNGRVGKSWRIGAALRNAVPVCLLTTTGKVTGQPRTVPLCYLADGDRILLVASKGGTAANPQWYGNLCADPDVQIEIGARRQDMRARTADAAEREVLWPKLVALYADYASYQEWTDREIPVVICEPVTA